MAKPPRGGMPDMQKLLKQAQQMQAEMQKVQDTLAEQRFEATAGGGAVKAVATGEGMVAEITIEPAVLDPDDAEIVGDLVMAAVNQALEMARTATSAAMGSAAGLDVDGLGLGDLLG